MTNTKHDEEIKELVRFTVSECSIAKSFENNDINSENMDDRLKTLNKLIADYKYSVEVINTRDGTIKQLQKHNTKLVNENESLRQTTARMDNEINNAHKDLVEINKLLNDSNINSYIINAGIAGEIAKKYDD